MTFERTESCVYGTNVFVGGILFHVFCLSIHTSVFPSVCLFVCPSVTLWFLAHLRRRLIGELIV